MPPNTRAIRLIAERALSYAPHHVASALGFFDEEHLSVVTSYESGPGGSWLADRLADGSADVARGGVWIPLMYRHRLEDLRIFALLCERNPQELLSRQPLDQFALGDLVGSRVLLPAAATSQWMFLEGILREAGVDVSAVRFIRDLEARTMTRLWRAGFGDYYLTSPPLSEQLLADGYSTAASLAALGGRVPWSVYYTTATFLRDAADVVASFARAILRALVWVEDHSAAEIVSVIKDDFAEWEEPLLVKCVGRLKKEAVWVPSVTVAEGPLMRYQGMIAAYGLIDTPVEYSSVVDSEIARFAANGA